MTAIEKHQDLKSKLLKGLKLSYERLLAEKRKNNQPIVVIENGRMVKKIPLAATKNGSMK